MFYSEMVHVTKLRLLRLLFTILSLAMAGTLIRTLGKHRYNYAIFINNAECTSCMSNIELIDQWATIAHMRADK